MEGGQGDCTIEAESELEATIEDGVEVDSTLCTVLDSVVSVLQGSVSIDGIQGTGFKGTTNNSCEQTSLTKSTSSELGNSGSNNQKIFTWWVIMLIIMAILFVLFTCFMIIWFRKRSTKLPENYDEVKKIDLEENEDDIHYNIEHSRTGTGSQAYSAIDVKHVTSESLGSCSTDEFDEQSWNNTRKHGDRK